MEEITEKRKIYRDLSNAYTLNQRISGERYNTKGHVLFDRLKAVGSGNWQTVLYDQYSRVTSVFQLQIGRGLSDFRPYYCSP